MVIDANRVTGDTLPGWLKGHLKPDGFCRIEEAVASAEKKTSGEIVPMIVRRSLPVSSQRMTLFLILVTLALLLHDVWWTDWFYTEHFFVIAGVSICFAMIAFLLPPVAWIERRLILPHDLTLFAQARAQVEFHEQHLESTHGATGILIFLSLFEHRAVVLADKAIASKLPKETWDEVLALLLHGVRRDDMAMGFVAAIERCGEILAQHFPPNADDIDELPNHLIIRG